MAFPNPEEPGAMDLAMALAAQVGADLVVANDPDADRCAAAVAGPARLADAARRRGRRAARRPPAARAASRASTRPRSCRRRCSASWPRPPASRTPRRSPASSGSAGSPGLAFGYEEALGYCVDPEHVRDKDGVSALLLLCELAAARQGRGPHADRPARRHRRRARPARHRPAVGAGRPTSPRSRAAMERLRATPPTTLGGLAVRAGRRPQRTAPPTCRRPTACATAWPTAPG